MNPISFGIEEECPTDCTLYVTDGEQKVVLLIESGEWRAVSYMLDAERAKKRARKQEENPGQFVYLDCTEHFTIPHGYCGWNILYKILYDEWEEM